MNNQRMCKHFLFIVTAILIAFCANGCQETAEHHEVDFSPEGKYVVFISDEEAENLLRFIRRPRA